MEPIAGLFEAVSYEYLAGAISGFLCRKNATALLRLCWGSRASPVAWFGAYLLLTFTLPGSAVAIYMDYGHEYRGIALAAVAMVSVAVVAFVAVGWRVGWLEEAIADYRAHKGEWVRADSPFGRLRDGLRDRRKTS